MYCFRLAQRCNLLMRLSRPLRPAALIASISSEQGARARRQVRAAARGDADVALHARHVEGQHDQLAGATSWCSWCADSTVSMSLDSNRPRSRARSPVSTAGTGGATPWLLEERSSDSRSGVPARDSTQG
jgi:hypothetical protein